MKKIIVPVTNEQVKQAKIYEDLIKGERYSGKNEIRNLFLEEINKFE